MENSIITPTISAEHQAAASGATLDDIQELIALLGSDVVLLPVPLGEKGPKKREWTNIAAGIMTDAAYLCSLIGGNIGVLLGHSSNGLCAIDVDSDEEAETFLKLNPILENTLTTRGARGCTFWVQMTGDYPGITYLKSNQGEKWGEFRSDKAQSIIFGQHPTGKTYTRLTSAPPIMLDLKDLVWPAHVPTMAVEQATKALVEKEGHPITVSVKGCLTLNRPALAEKFVKEQPISYEDGAFLKYQEESGLFHEVDKAVLCEVISASLKALADETGLADIGTKRDPKLLRDILTLVKGKLASLKPTVGSEKFDNPVHVGNGVLELTATSGRLMSFHPSYHSRTQIPHSFDPEARCPRFESDLLKAVLSDEDISLLQRYVGSMLLGPNHAQRILLMKGAAGSGKSTVLNIIEGLVGTNACREIRMAHLGGRFELADAGHCRLLTGSDVASDYLSSSNASFLKKLTGGESINVERKGGAQFQLKGNFHIIITSNPLLTIHLDGDAGAWERRMLLIEFGTPKHKTNIPDLASTLLKEEGPGILNFFLRGAMQYLEEKETHGGFALTPTQLTLVHDLVHQSNSIQVFAEQMVEKMAGGEALTSVLYAIYRDFCDAHE